jgi:uroporphyrinogen decarboxylase
VRVFVSMQVVQLFDSWAHHLSPTQFEEFSRPYAERVLQAVKARHPGVPLIFHANGGTGKLLQMDPISSDVLGLDWNTEMREARALYGPRRVLQVRASCKDCDLMFDRMFL